MKTVHLINSMHITLSKLQKELALVTNCKDWNVDGITLNQPFSNLLTIVETLNKKKQQKIIFFLWGEGVSGY